MTRFFAHSLKDAPEDEWQDLAAHLRAVGEIAGRFGAKFGMAEAARAAGLLHDLGKYSAEFQAKLRGAKSRVDHSTAGAQVAIERFGPIGRILAYVIAGHHAGLANGRAFGGGTLPPDERLTSARAIEPWFDRSELPPLKRPPSPLLSAQLDPFGWAFFVRMLFSALVDADFLETERWFAKASGEPVERGWHGTLGQLKTALDRRLSTFSASTSINAAGLNLAQLRAEVLQDCRAAADNQTGFFALTVPTGGGKTIGRSQFCAAKRSGQRSISKRLELA